MLDSHMTRCESCRVFKSSVARFTTELRAAPLEHWIGSGYSFRVRRRRLPLAVTRSAAAAAALVAIASPALVSQLDPQHRTRTITEPIILDGTTIENDQRTFLHQLRNFSHTGRLTAADINAPGHPGPIPS